MPQIWAAVPNENPHRLYSLQVGGVAPAVFGSLRGHQRRCRDLFLQCHLENICGSKGRGKSDSARAGQRICDNIFEPGPVRSSGRMRLSPPRSAPIRSKTSIKIGSDSPFKLRWVGRQGRHIATPPVDTEMARAIEAFASTADRNPSSELKTINDQPVLRTIYPSLATEQSCVDCHNQLQAGRQQWRLNDVMGAFAIDIPVGGFLEDIKTRSYTVGFCLFTALAGLGLAISILHFRQLSEREAAAIAMYGRRTFVFTPR